MPYSFDSWGWLSLTEIPNRTTEIEPPQHGERIVGQPYPNFISPTDGWTMATYYEPPTPPVVNPKLAILAQLAEIDAKSDSPRARREALLGNTTWLNELDGQAYVLRTQLGKL